MSTARVGQSLIVGLEYYLTDLLFAFDTIVFSIQNERGTRFPALYRGLGVHAHCTRSLRCVPTHAHHDRMYSMKREKLQLSDILGAVSFLPDGCGCFSSYCLSTVYTSAGGGLRKRMFETRRHERVDS